jgi:hypothetical protein
MEGSTIRKYKLFTAWQDDKEEAWLREMARTGLHLTLPLFPCVYTFVHGEPCDVAYRLDYVPRIRRDELGVYLQVFRDAGWEHLGEMAGWQYFRKPVQAGEPPEIYTDPESKIQKYWRLLGVLAVSLTTSIIVLTRIDDRPHSPGFELFSIALILVYLVLTYGLIRIAWRILQLRRL